MQRVGDRSITSMTVEGQPDPPIDSAKPRSASPAMADHEDQCDHQRRQPHAGLVDRDDHEQRERRRDHERQCQGMRRHALHAGFGIARDPCPAVLSGTLASYRNLGQAFAMQAGAHDLGIPDRVLGRVGNPASVGRDHFYWLPSSIPRG